MEKLLSILCFVTCSILFSQTDNLVGDYVFKDIGQKHLTEYRLSLIENGRFVFQSYTKDSQGLTPVIHEYYEGRWSFDENIVSFSSDKKKESSLNLGLHLNNTTARIITNSAKEERDELVKIGLRFIKSEISWIEGFEIFKI